MIPSAAQAVFYYLLSVSVIVGVDIGHQRASWGFTGWLIRLLVTSYASSGLAIGGAQGNILHRNKIGAASRGHGMVGDGTWSLVRHPG